MTRLGYQIPNFTYPEGGPAGIFPTVVEQAKAAEAAGFDRLFLMDHFYQLPGIGDPTTRCSSATRHWLRSPSTPTRCGCRRS